MQRVRLERHIWVKWHCQRIIAHLFMTMKLLEPASASVVGAAMEDDGIERKTSGYSGPTVDPNKLLRVS